MSVIIRNLNYTYKTGTPLEKTALRGINLKLNQGEFVGIIGSTGSGKTTLIQHFNGLLKPSSGKVYIDGIDTNKKDLRQLRRKVGIIFQYPEHQLFEETVYKDISFGLLKSGFDGKKISERINMAISAVGLKENILGKSPFDLSGGQKRRVAIAGVIAMKPDILVMDEPTAGLDPGGRDELFNYISEFHKSTGKIIAIVSHNMEEVARLVQRVIVLYNGSVEMDGSPEEVFKNHERLESIGLSSPGITYFMKKLKKTVPEISESIYTVKDAVDELIKFM